MITMSPFIMAAKKQSVSPDIWYDWSYIRDAGDVKLDNLGILGDQYDATAYVAAGCEFTGTQLVDVPLEYTIGNNIIINGDFENGLNGWSVVKNNGTAVEENGRAHLTKDSSGYNFIINDASIENIVYEISGDVELVSGNLTIQGAADADINDKTISSSGTFTTGIKPQNNKLYFGIHYNNSGEFYLDNVSVKPVTFQTKSLWIYDYSDNTWHITTYDQFTDVKYRIENRTIGHFFTLNTTHTQSDIDLLNANPELALNLVLGDTDTGLSFGKGDIGAYYQPDIHSGKYIVDITSAYTEVVSNTDFKNDINGWEHFWNNNTSIIHENESLKITLNVDSTNDGARTFSDGIAYELCYVAGEYDATNCDAMNFSVNYGGSTGDLTGKGSFGFLRKMGGGDVDTDARAYIKGSTGEYGIVKYFSIKKITNYIQIQNYTGDEAYTNADQQTKGIPLTAYKQDNFGRIIGKADPGMGEFNGDGRYVDTGWIPDYTKSFTFSVVSFTGDYTEHQDYDDTFIGTSDGHGGNTGIFRYRSGDSYYISTPNSTNNIITIPKNSLVEFTIVWDATNKISKIYKNGALQKNISGDYKYQIVKPFYIGAGSHENGEPIGHSLYPIGFFKIHLKALTEAEVAEQYEKVKQIYPDLP